MNTANDTILNNEDISLFLVLLDSSTNIIDTNQTESLKRKLSRLAEVYHLIQDDKYNPTHKLISVRLTLEAAIIKKQMVSFAYTRYGTCHTVEPYRIVQASGVNYLVAGQQGRTMRYKKYCLDFIDDLHMTEKCFDAIPHLVAMMLNGAKTIWFSEKSPVKVVVEFDQRVAHFFKREQFFPAQKIIEENSDGSIVITVMASNRMDFFLQSARWMPHFRIIGPPEYRELICERALQTVERNKPLNSTVKLPLKQGLLSAALNSVKSFFPTAL